MIIQNLKLANIRSYKNEEIRFPEGNLLLSGDIGSGKSTILLAIEFALFGLRKGSLGGSSLLRHGSKEGSVELKMTISKNASVDRNINKESSEDKIIIKRGLKRVKDSVLQDAGYIIINDKKIDGTAMELRAKILDILGYPKSLLTKSKDLLYRYTVYTPQEDMKQILFEEKESRLEILRRIFGIHKYRIVRDNASIYSRELSNLRRELLVLSSGADIKKNILEEKNVVLKSINSSLLELQHSLSILRERIEKKEQLLRELDGKVRLHRKLSKEKDICEAKLTEKTSRLNRLLADIEVINKELLILGQQVERVSVTLVPELLSQPDAESLLEQELRDKEQHINTVEKEKSMASLHLDNLSRMISSLQDELLQKEESIKKLQSKTLELANFQKQLSGKSQAEDIVKSKEDELSRINSRLQEFAIRKSESESIISNINKLDSCPLCLQEVDPYHKKQISSLEKSKISKYDENQKIFTAELESASKVLLERKISLEALLEIEKSSRALEAEIRLLLAAAKDIDSKRFSLNSYLTKKVEIEKKSEQLKQINIAEQKEEISGLRENIRALRDYKAIHAKIQERESRKKIYSDTKNDAQSEHQALIRDREELILEIKDMLDIDKTFEFETKELNMLKLQEKESEIKKAGLSADLDNIRKIVLELESEIAQKEASNKKLRDIEQLQSWLDNSFVNITQVIEKAVMSRIHREFNSLFRDWFGLLVEDELLGARLDESFTPIIEQNGYETDVENLSGGEKTGLALAYRLALNRVINDFVGTIRTKDIIILDEPTDGFSSEQLDKLRDVLDQLGVRQCIIVSHEAKIEGMVEQIIRISKREHSSGVSYS